MAELEIAFMCALLRALRTILRKACQSVGDRTKVEVEDQYAVLGTLRSRSPSCWMHATIGAELEGLRLWPELMQDPGSTFPRTQSAVSPLSRLEGLLRDNCIAR
jgi:hypothetical protein